MSEKQNVKDIQINTEEREVRKDRNERRILRNMKKKLVILFFITLLAFIMLGISLFLISYKKGDAYKKTILSQQEYSSSIIPYKRGSIEDANGTTLATSKMVYNLIIDSKVIMSGTDKKYLEPTIKALSDCFGLNQDELRAYITGHKTSSYYRPLKKLSYDEISIFLQRESENANIQGVWFEEEYEREYPYGSLACDAIGFTTSDGSGMYGLEQYYNDILSGTNGRTYGYYSEDSNLERTTIPAQDGNTIVSTIDLNIQSVVEEKLLEFNEEHKDEYREGNGSYHSACIVMEVKTGNVLAMAEYPNFDLNDPYDLTSYYTQDEIDAMETERYYTVLNEIWSNFCISSTYEPGSTAKPFTIAAAIETGAILGNETYTCNGVLDVGIYKIHCNNRYGHGKVTVQEALEKSCNVALMYIGKELGKDQYLRFQRVFNFGMLTGIDLAGEAKTSALVYNEKTMGVAELATSSFGQGQNYSMIQMMSAFCSLINGGMYYEPHMVSEIRSSTGTLIKKVEPKVLKQTVSLLTSQKMVTFLNAVATTGTGKSARPAGYKIGGKTGTAETVLRDGENYVVSFIGYAPADDPQVAVYVVIDRPNVKDQAHATYASHIVRSIFTEILPYMNIFKTEELSNSEVDELVNLGLMKKDDGTVYDPETGYNVNPATGEFFDPVTGQKVTDTSQPLVE